MTLLPLRLVPTLKAMIESLKAPLKEPAKSPLVIATLTGTASTS